MPTGVFAATADFGADDAGRRWPTGCNGPGGELAAMLAPPVPVAYPLEEEFDLGPAAVPHPGSSGTRTRPVRRTGAVRGTTGPLTRQPDRS